MARAPSFPAKLISMIIENKEPMNKFDTLKKIVNLCDELNKTEDQFQCTIIINEMQRVLNEHSVLCCKATLEKVSEMVNYKYNGSYQCKLDVINEENIVLI